MAIFFFLQTPDMICLRQTVTPVAGVCNRKHSRRGRHTVFSAPEFRGCSKTRPGLPPFASALVALCSRAHQLKPLNVPSALHTTEDPTPLTTPKISWFPGLVLTAAQFIFARVSHRGLFRRSTIPWRMEQVCVCVRVRGGSLFPLSH